MIGSLVCGRKENPEPSQKPARRRPENGEGLGGPRSYSPDRDMAGGELHQELGPLVADGWLIGFRVLRA